MTFGLPVVSYVPTTKTGVGYMMVFAPIDFFIFLLPIFYVKISLTALHGKIFYFHGLLTSRMEQGRTVVDLVCDIKEW